MILIIKFFVVIKLGCKQSHGTNKSEKGEGSVDGENYVYLLI